MARVGFTATAHARVVDGVGYVRSRTIEFGATVIVAANIGSIRFYEGDRNLVWATIGVALILVGLVQLSSSSSALILVIIGALMILANFLAKPELMLSIGTCDGRYTDIISTDREFLMNALEFLQRKIDEEGVTGVIDVSARSVG